MFNLNFTMDSSIFSSLANDYAVKGRKDSAKVHESVEVSTSRNAARERSRVRSLRAAFHSLQMSLKSVPPNTKLSKLDILVLATNYISHLTRVLQQDKVEDQSEDANNEIQEKSVTIGEARCMNAGTATYGSKPTTAHKISRRNRNNYLHPVKKWPIRSRLYAGCESGTVSKCTKN